MKEPLGVSNLGLGHTRYSLKGQLDPPKASGTELRELLTLSRNIIVRALSNRRGIDVGGPGGAEAELVEQVHRGSVEGDGSVGLGERRDGFCAEVRETKEGFREKARRSRYGGDEKQSRGGGGGGGGAGQAL